MVEYDWVPEENSFWRAIWHPNMFMILVQASSYHSLSRFLSVTGAIDTMSSQVRGTEFPSPTHPQKSQKSLISHSSHSLKQKKRTKTKKRVNTTKKQWSPHTSTSSDRRRKTVNQHSQNIRVSIQQTKKKKDRQRETEQTKKRPSPAAQQPSKRGW